MHSQLHFFAHVHPHDESKNQNLREHLYRTAEYAKAFAHDFKHDEMAYITGLMHDIGK